MPEVLSPKASGEFIVRNAKHLQVHQAGIEKLAQEITAGILDGRISVKNFSQHQLHPSAAHSQAAEWIFVLDTLNFCFWTPTDYTKYRVNDYTGYFALCAAIKRALAEGVDILNAAFYAEIDEATFRHIFRSDDGVTEVPLIKQRIDCLHEVGKRLLEKWHGQFSNVVRAANQSAKALLQLIVQEFPCFRDEANYAGHRVAIYKRAQILIGDLWACYHGEALGQFHDIEYITMFADYRIPQVLVHYGALEYSADLLELLKKDTILQNGDAMEVEIRGASIYIVEQAKEAVLAALQKTNKNVSTVNAILIDHFLWDYRRDFAKELEYIPFHKTLSIYY